MVHISIYDSDMSCISADICSTYQNWCLYQYVSDLSYLSFPYGDVDYQSLWESEMLFSVIVHSWDYKKLVNLQWKISNFHLKETV